MQDIQDLLQMLVEALATVAAQFATIWLPIQIALIVVGAMLGWATATLIRKRLQPRRPDHGLAGVAEARGARACQQFRRHRLHSADPADAGRAGGSAVADRI
jgi:hypothetical protein